VVLDAPALLLAESVVSVTDELSADEVTAEIEPEALPPASRLKTAPPK
jgi:hypothetical protein